jgi:cytochrome c556
MRKPTIIAVLLAALITPAVKAADVTEADYQKAMKDVQAGLQAIGRTLRENSGELSGAAAGAKSIDAALASIESFWAARKDQEAIKMNAAARDAAKAVAKAAESKDAAATEEARKALGGTCKACHDVHREQLPDKTYKIK